MTDNKKAQEEAAATGALPELTRGDGPWDYADVPDGEAFVSFGPLKVPALPTLKARVEVDQATQRIGAVAVLVDECMVQLQVLASPSGSEVWGGVRRKITERAQAIGGTTQAVEGEFGTELVVTIPVKLPNGMPGAESSRYVGVEGSRWLLRAVVNGSRGLEDATVAKVNALLSRCAVERGDEAMAAGAVMELSMPQGEIDEEAAKAAQAKLEESGD